MTASTPQQQVQRMRQCVQDCGRLADDLQNLAKQAHSPELQSSLKEAAHHIEMSIQECSYAIKATP